jgi:hypothetical protein
MALSQNHVTDICLFGCGNQECRYLDGEADQKTGNMTFICKKKSLERKMIDEEVAEQEADCKKNNINPLSIDAPMGDNCSGYLPMKTLLQGYDV